MTPKSLLARAVAAGKLAHRQGEQDGWSDGWHTQASTAESLRLLRDSATGVAKSTAQTATTREGWRRIARGASKAVGGAAVVVGGVAQGMLHHSSQPPAENNQGQDLGWGDFGSGYGYYGKDGNRMD